MGTKVMDTSTAIEVIEPSKSPPDKSLAVDNPSAASRDVPFAYIFMLNVIVMVFFASSLGVPALMKQFDSKSLDEATFESTVETTHNVEIQVNYEGLVGLMVVILICSVIFAILWLKLLLHFSNSIIYIAIFSGIGCFAASAGACFIEGVPAPGVLISFMCAGLCAYAWCIRDGIPFAAATLKVSCAAVVALPNIFLVSILVLAKSALWTLIWGVAVIGMASTASPNNETECPEGQCKNSGTPILALLWLSYYWGQQVCQNIGTCSIAGAVGSWWFQPEAQNPTKNALKRSLTKSFGSICIGSLIIAIIQMLKKVLGGGRNGNGGVVQSILGCFCAAGLNIIEYLNDYSYVYIALYGSSFRESGAAVYNLFKSRGISVAVNDSVISFALSFVSFGIGLLTGGCGVALVFMTPLSWYDNNELIQTLAVVAMGIFGLLVGFVMSKLVCNVIDTATNTVLVCFLEDPAAFKANHLELYEHLVGAWKEYKPEALNTAFKGELS